MDGKDVRIYENENRIIGVIPGIEAISRMPSPDINFSGSPTVTISLFTDIGSEDVKEIKAIAYFDRVKDLMLDIMTENNANDKIFIIEVEHTGLSKEMKCKAAEIKLIGTFDRP